VNAPLRANGSAEVDVILELDGFDAHAAVIGHATRSLFLRAVPAEPGAAPGTAPSLVRHPRLSGWRCR